LDLTLKVLLGDELIAKDLIWKSTQEKSPDGRLYSTFTSAKWMEHAVSWVEAKSSTTSNALIFALGSDATTMVNWGTRSFHPIYLWLLNTAKDTEVNTTFSFDLTMF
jgi:hypothetical protein